MIAQHHLLSFVAAEVDEGCINTTLSEVLTPIKATKLRKALAMSQAGTARGKIVPEGFWEFPVAVRSDRFIRPRPLATQRISVRNMALNMQIKGKQRQVVDPSTRRLAKVWAQSKSMQF